MFTSIDEVSQHINDLLILHKINKKVTWKYNNRFCSKKSGGISGRFSQPSGKNDKPLIEFSYKLFSKNLENRAFINEVILHEIAHALDYFTRGDTKHDKEFRKICYSIGSDGHIRSDKYFKYKK